MFNAGALRHEPNGFDDNASRIRILVHQQSRVNADDPTSRRKVAS